MTDMDRVAELALEMVARIRDVDPQRNRIWWLSLTEEERWALPWALAAMVDPEASTSALFGWTWQLGGELLAERFGPTMPRDLPRRKAAS